MAMYYCGSRYYDPAVGRFINADAYVSTGLGIVGYNMFAYCNNNPVMLQDAAGDRPILSTSTANETKADRQASFSYMNNAAKVKLASLPKTGEPGPSQTLPNPDGTPKQKRWYGPDGNPIRDRDYNHPGEDIPFPHDHEWKDGKRGEEHLPPSSEYQFSFDPVIGVGLFTVSLIGIIVITADDITGVGVGDDFLLGPLGAGVTQGAIMIFR